MSSEATDAPVVHLIAAPDGRTIAWSEFGDPDGVPCFAFHGCPSSRLQGLGLDDPARRVGVRLIATDRPGFGRSDPHRGRTLLDYPKDVGTVADHLGLGTFAVLGLSGGGAYALACGHQIPERLSCVGLVGSMGPFAEHPETKRDMDPWLRELFERSALPAPVARAAAAGLRARDWLRTKLDANYPARQYELQIAKLPAPERALFADPVLGPRRAAMQAEGMRQGPEQFRVEASLLWRHWGFALEHVFARVEMWHGTEDVNVPISIARAMAARLPDCTTHFLRGSHIIWRYHEDLELEVFQTIAKHTAGAA